MNASICYILIYKLDCRLFQNCSSMSFFDRDANNYEIKTEFGYCLLGKDFGEDPNDCPGSCNMTYTGETFDKIDDCECVCIAGYTGIYCTVIILTK